jgi:hypothetical protein
MSSESHRCYLICKKDKLSKARRLKTNQEQVNVAEGLSGRTKFQPSFSHVLPSYAPCVHTFAPVGASILEDASVLVGDINTARIPPGSLHHASATTAVQTLIFHFLCLD